MISRTSPMVAKRRVTGAGVQLQAYSMSGGGPTLVCIHGLTTGGCVFFHLLPLLGADWTRVAIDLRGHGLSDRAAGRYALADYAADVAAVLEHEIDGSAVLFGHSLGGGVALMTALRAPDRVRAVIIGDTPLSAAAFKDSRYPALLRSLRPLASSDRPFHEVEAALAELPVDRSTPPTRYGDLPDVSPALIRLFAKLLIQTDPEALALDVASLIESVDGKAALRSLRKPTLLLQADRRLGGLMSDDDVRDLCTVGSDVTCVPLHGVSHLLHLHQVEPVVKAISCFLASL